MKLYWRFKKNGKWTWQSVLCTFDQGICTKLVRHPCVIDYTYQEEE